MDPGGRVISRAFRRFRIEDAYQTAQHRGHEDRKRASSSTRSTVSDPESTDGAGHARCLFTFAAWQVDLERGPMPGTAFDANRSAALLNNAVDRCQTESRASALLFRREEGFENPRHDVGWHAAARIADLEPDVAAGRQPERCAVAVIEVHVGQREVEPPATGHRVTGIDGQVDQHLLDLARVGLDRTKTRRDRGRNFDVLGDQPAKQLLRSRENLVEWRALAAWNENLSAAEGSI